MNTLYFSQTISLLLVNWFALMSPGSDFAMTLKHTVTHGKRSGFFTAAGITLGCCVHLFYTVVGLGFVLSQSMVFMWLVKIIGAAYLFKVGFQSWREAKPMPPHHHENLEPTEVPASGWSCLRAGFITNLFNPKATLFFLAVFTSVVDVQTPWPLLALDSFGICIETMIWFSLVVYVFSKPSIRTPLLAKKYLLDKAMAIFFVGLGAYLLFGHV